MTTTGELVGREQELAAVERFLAGEEPGHTTLVLEGPPGIGKTSIWSAGVAAAGRLRALVARPAGEEASFGFSGLADLLADVDAELYAALPPARRRPLEGALLLGDDTAPVSTRAVAAAVLAVLRTLADERPLLVAIDDLQWLDDASQVVLAYAARRLEAAPVRFLVTVRSATGGPPGPLEVALRERADVVAVQPLTLGGVGRLLKARLDVVLPRPALQRVYATSGGNPLFALELGRLIARSDHAADAARDLPLPERIEEALAGRLAALDEPAAEALLVAALGPATIAELTAVAGDEALADAEAAGVVTVDGNRVRPSHPLLGAAAQARARPAELRALHRALADAVADDERAVRHLALAQDQPDEEVARTVAAAAERASRRGAAVAAAELGAHARRLTPEDAPGRSERLLAVAEYEYAIANLQAAREAARELLDELPPGAPRVRALIMIANSARGTDDEPLLERALAEAGDEPVLQARVLTVQAFNQAVNRVQRLGEALDRGEAAARLSEEGGGDPVAEIEVLGNLMWIRQLRGAPVDDLMPRYRRAEPLTQVHVYDSAERALAVGRIWQGRLAEARELLRGLLAVATQQEDEISYFIVRLHLCEAALRAGAWDTVAALLEEWDLSLTDLPGDPASYARCRALLAAGRGEDDAAELARDAYELSLAHGRIWQQLEAQRALGIAELLAGRTAAAVEHLREVWRHTRSAGVEDPGAFPVAPDLVEALAAAGRVTDARAVAADLRTLAERLGHPWALATAARCDGVVLLAERAPAEAEPLLEEAAARFQELGLPFDRARTLVALGTARRQSKRLRTGREAVAEAERLFAEIGSPGWAAWARLETARFGGRSASPGLTQTEERIAGLVRSGKTNKEVAAELTISVSAVERHLTRIYAKLGVRSRTELAGLDEQSVGFSRLPGADSRS